MRKLSGFWAKLCTVISIALALFLLYNSISSYLHPHAIVYACIGISMVMCFMFYPFSKKEPVSNVPSRMDIVLMVLSIIVCVYPLINLTRFTETPWVWTITDVILSVILYALAVEGSRRILGWFIPGMALFLLFYSVVLGDIMPGIFWFGGFNFGQIMGSTFYVSAEGYAGTITKVMTMVVGLFLILGPTFFATGAGNVFTGLSKLIATKLRGGAAQTAVISSAAFGTISGSGIANVTTTGVFTIPLMKSAGYTPEQAAAVETTASTGGQLMPPVMGAAVFLMADFLGIPYVNLCIAAAIPAILYFTAVGFGVYYMSCKRGIPKLPAALAPRLNEIITPRNTILTVVPFGLLLALLIMGYTPQFSAGMALLAAVVQFLLWGRFSRGEFMSRVSVIVKEVSSAIAVLAWLVVFSTCMQTIVTLIMATGLGEAFAKLVWLIGGQNAFLALVLTAIAAIVLGMGLPTTAIYIIGVATLATGLRKLGFPELPIHFFIFYFGMLAMTTPPVCPGVFAAIAIAKTRKIWRTAMIAMALAAAAYIVPFMFMYKPSLLAIGDIGTIATTFITGIFGCIVLPASLFGYFIKPTTILESILLFAGGMLLLFPDMLASGVGAALVILTILSQFYMPEFAFIGRRPPEPSVRQMADLTAELKVAKEDTSSIPVKDIPVE